MNTDGSFEPLTRETFKAAMDKMIAEPIRIEPDMEHWHCEHCHLLGEKIMGYKMACPRCGGKITDLESLWKDAMIQEDIEHEKKGKGDE